MSVTSEKIVTLSKPYFGPATEQFLARQCKSHLKIELADLGPTHLKDLSKWVELGAGLIMDPAKGKELANKIATI
jgi:hypothetical protein